MRKCCTATVLLLLLAQLMLSGSLIPASTPKVDASSEPPAWPEGGAAYDNVATLAGFGYRKVDTTANSNARDWIAEELVGLGLDVERHGFATEDCDDCENIVVTINGTLEDDWLVFGAHHDAICYVPVPVGITYAGCSSSGAYDDGTGSGALLELARAISQWNGTPQKTWKLGWWDYEEYQGQGSSEGGGQGSLNFVSEHIPEGTNVTYVNLDMFGLSWPVPTPAASRASGCDEDFWTLYMFTSPVEDWSYYEDRGLEISEEMRANAEWFQTRLKTINSNLSHPEEWVRVIDDTRGNSDHFNFIMRGHTATWLRGQHQYVYQEGDTCEQTPKHAQSDSMSTLNTMAGGRSNVEAGLQTGLDIMATLAWWDLQQGINASTSSSTGDEATDEGLFAGSAVPLPLSLALLLLAGLAASRRSRDEGEP